MYSFQLADEYILAVICIWAKVILLDEYVSYKSETIYLILLDQN